MHKFKARKAGFSLTEAIIVLGIVGLVLGGIWGAASNVSRTNEIRTVTETIVKVAQNLRMLYNERNSFTAAQGTDITTMLINSGVIPLPNVNTAANTAITVWNTRIQVLVGPAISGTTPNSFRIHLFPTLDADDCSGVSSIMIGPGREPALRSIAFNGGMDQDPDAVNISTLGNNPCNEVSFLFALK